MANHIELFRTISVVFLIFALALLVIAAILFFVFDIPMVLGILTGRAARKTILKMEKRNAQTGQLRNPDETPQMLKKIEDVISYPVTERMEGTMLSSDMEESMGETDVLAARQDMGSQETGLLGPEPDQSAGRFVLLKNEMLIHTAEVI